MSYKLIENGTTLYEGNDPLEMKKALEGAYDFVWGNEDKEDYKHALGLFLRETRQLQKKTLKQLSGLTDISVSNIKQYETGASDPSSFNFFKLAKALRVPDLKEFYETIYMGYAGSEKPKKANIEEDDLINQQIFEYMCKLKVLNSEGMKKVFDFIDLVESHPDYQMDYDEDL